MTPTRETAVTPRLAPRRRAPGAPRAILAALVLTLSPFPPASAQDLFAYPAKGQTPEQQRKDTAECHAWAAQQTGFDPSRPPPQAASPASAAEAPQGGLLRGAARGALVGTVGGAIAGHAGKGAAIGAATGGMMGGMRRRDQERRQAYEAQSYQQQQGATLAHERGAFDRALTACLTGRGYSIG